MFSLFTYFLNCIYVVTERQCSQPVADFTFSFWMISFTLGDCDVGNLGKLLLMLAVLILHEYVHFNVSEVMFSGGATMKAFIVVYSSVFSFTPLTKSTQEIQQKASSVIIIIIIITEIFRLA